MTDDMFPEDSAPKRRRRRTQKNISRWHGLFGDQTFSGWFLSRNWIRLLYGLPAILVTIGIVGICYWTRAKWQPRQLQYRNALQTALTDENDELATRYVHKLIGLRAGDDPNVELIRATIDLRSGRTEQAMETINRLAPTDSEGMPRAHLWVARQMIGKGNLNPSNVSTLKHHLVHSAKLSSQKTWALTVLSEIVLRERNYTEAIGYLEQVVDTKPELAVLLGDVLMKTDRAADANKAYSLAESHFKQRLSEDPTDHKATISLAVAQARQGNFKLAEATLAGTLTNDKQNTQLRASLASLYVDRSAQIAKDAQLGDQESVVAFRLIERALAVAPNHPGALNGLSKFLEAGGDADGELKNRINNMLASESGTALLHFVLATHSLQSGDDKSAEFHLKRAYIQDPKMPALLNNIAWMLANKEPPELDKALILIGKGLASLGADKPIYPQMIDTRGHIFVKMERWESAIDDLEKAIPGLSKSSKQSSHLALATAYRAIGLEDIASAHEDKAQALTFEQ